MTDKFTVAKYFMPQKQLLAAAAYSDRIWNACDIESAHWIRIELTVMMNKYLNPLNLAVIRNPRLISKQRKWLKNHPTKKVALSFPKTKK